MVMVMLEWGEVLQGVAGSRRDKDVSSRNEALLRLPQAGHWNFRPAFWAFRPESKQ